MVTRIDILLDSPVDELDSIWFLRGILLEKLYIFKLRIERCFSRRTVTEYIRREYVCKWLQWYSQHSSLPICAKNLLLESPADLFSVLCVEFYLLAFQVS